MILFYKLWNLETKAPLNLIRGFHKGMNVTHFLNGASLQDVCLLPINVSHDLLCLDCLVYFTAILLKSFSCKILSNRLVSSLFKPSLSVTSVYFRLKIDAVLAVLFQHLGWTIIIHYDLRITSRLLPHHLLILC